MIDKKDLPLSPKELILKIESTKSPGKTLFAVFKKSYHGTYKVFYKKKFHNRVSSVVSIAKL